MVAVEVTVVMVVVVDVVVVTDVVVVVLQLFSFQDFRQPVQDPINTLKVPNPVTVTVWPPLLKRFGNISNSLEEHWMPLTVADLDALSLHL